MKRSGFTMIELIFVIVIIGILSAVALPKFLGVAQSAHLANVKSYIGTFNMTTGPSLWSQSLTDDLNGSVANMGDGNLTANLPNPTGITFSTKPTLSGCVAGESVSTSPSKNFAKFTIGSTTYYIGCVDGNTTSSPHLWLTDGTKIILQ